MVHLLDRVLLALMPAEIIYTVGRISRTQMLETEPFLIVGIIAAIRRMLIITAEGAGHIDLTDPVFQAPSGTGTAGGGHLPARLVHAPAG